MANLTREHMVDAAERVRYIDNPKQRAAAMNMFIEFFRHWSPNFDVERFKNACVPDEREEYDRVQRLIHG